MTVKSNNTHHIDHYQTILATRQTQSKLHVHTARQQWLSHKELVHHHKATITGSTTTGTRTNHMHMMYNSRNFNHNLECLMPWRAPSSCRGGDRLLWCPL